MRQGNGNDSKEASWFGEVVQQRTMAKRLTLLERLLTYREFDPVTGCWLWTKARGKKGYGQIWVDGKTARVSRVAFVVFKGAIPDGLDVLHSCDNPPCFNPEHLFAGTQSENVKDSVRKGRWGSKPQPFCKRGHRRLKRGPCPVCHGAYLKLYYRRNRAKILARARLRDRRK